jgi:peptide/nickel transport system permease protein
MSLRTYLIKRLLYTLILTFFVIILNWIIFEAMPGFSGNVYSALGQQGRIGPAQYNHQIALYGLDKPYWTRFYDYIKAMLTFQFGFSYASNQDVTYEMISTGKLTNTLVLLGTSTVFAIIIGTVLGIIISRKRGSTLDSFWVTTSLTTFSLPTFFMGILLIFVFSIALNWFPSGSTHPNTWDIVGANLTPPLFQQLLIRLQYLFLPALTLTLFAYGGFLLLTRATMMEALSEDYILTARAKGLTERAILFKHAFKNASLPLITNAALSFAFILSGAIITETIFNWDGLGRWLFSSIGYKDYPVMQAMFYIIALCVIAANFVSDILYGIVDPRIKYE